MSKSLRKSLNLDMTDLAEMLRSKGRGKDTVLAHITPREAALLKSRGGRGSKNPHTGLPEYDDGDFGFDFGGGGADYTPSYDPVAPEQPAAPEQPVDQSGGGGPVTADNGVTQTDTSITSPFSYQQPGDANAPQYLPGRGDESVQSANIDTSQTGEGGFAPGEQEPAPKSLGDYASSLYDKLFGTGGDTTGGGGLSSLMKLLGPAAVAALGEDWYGGRSTRTGCGKPNCCSCSCNTSARQCYNTDNDRPTCSCCNTVWSTVWRSSCRCAESIARRGR